MTPWGASNPSSLVLNSPESRVPSIGDFCVLEKTPFLLGNSSIPPKPWSDSSIPLVGIFTRSFVIVPAKFGEVWTCFDPPIVKSWIEPRGKTEFLRRAEFILSPVEPALPMIAPVH